MNWPSLGESELQHDLKVCAPIGYLLLKPEFGNLSCAIFDYTRALIIGRVLVSTTGDLSK